MENLFNMMEKIVEVNMKIYQEDFYNYDKKELLNANEGESYIWYVRDSGTNIYKYEIVHLADHQERTFLEYWLTSAKVYKVDVKKVDSGCVYGDIKELQRAHVKDLLNSARPMTVAEKLKEVKEWALFEGHYAKWQDRALVAFKYYKLNEKPTLKGLYALLMTSTVISKEKFLTILDGSIKGSVKKII